LWVKIFYEMRKVERRTGKEKRTPLINASCHPSAV
jgi:hypothetical protein